MSIRKGYENLTISFLARNGTAGYQTCRHHSNQKLHKPMVARALMATPTEASPAHIFKIFTHRE